MEGCGCIHVSVILDLYNLVCSSSVGLLCVLQRESDECGKGCERGDAEYADQAQLLPRAWEVRGSVMI